MKLTAHHTGSHNVVTTLSHSCDNLVTTWLRDYKLLLCKVVHVQGFFQDLGQGGNM